VGQANAAAESRRFRSLLDLVELLANEALDVAVQTANLTVALR
jgi:hypothetical protein